MVACEGGPTHAPAEARGLLASSPPRFLGWSLPLWPVEAKGGVGGSARAFWRARKGQERDSYPGRNASTRFTRAYAVHSLVSTLTRALPALEGEPSLIPRSLGS